jgi:hypothetical protein
MAGFQDRVRVHSGCVTSLTSTDDGGRDTV